MSTERIIVDQRVADAFVKKFTDKARGLPLGDPRKPEPVVLGSVIGMPTVQHCNALIDDALAKGAKLMCGAKAETTLMPATVLDHVNPSMRIYREETFGPVKCVVRVKGTEEAIACANDNEYGLSAAVFGRDIARAFNVARKIDSGICHVNGPTVHDEAQMPFGGVKGSGYGSLRRQGGHRGVHRAALDHGADVAAALSLLAHARGGRCYPSRPTHRSVSLEKRNATQTDLVDPGCGAGGRCLCAATAAARASRRFSTGSHADAARLRHQRAARRRRALLRHVRAQGLVLQLTFSCYLIKHGDEYMVWDTGHSHERRRGGAEGEPGRPARTAEGEARADQVRRHQPLPRRPHRPGRLVSRRRHC